MALNFDELVKRANEAVEPSDANKTEEPVPDEVLFDLSIDLDEEPEDDEPDEPDYGHEEEEDEDELEDDFEDVFEDDFEDDEDFYLPIDEPRVEIAPFRPHEEDNLAYADAVTAYYDEKNYEVAIGKFQDAIDNERKRGARKPNEIIAKSMYWQAESYVKNEAFEHATEVLESLIELFARAGRGHYLVVAAQRRLETLKSRGA